MKGHYECLDHLHDMDNGCFVNSEHGDAVERVSVNLSSLLVRTGDGALGGGGPLLSG